MIKGCVRWPPVFVFFVLFLPLRYTVVCIHRLSLNAGARVCGLDAAGPSSNVGCHLLSEP